MANDDDFPKVTVTAQNVRLASFLHNIGKSNSSIFTLQDGETTIHFPAFKFLGARHAQSMLDVGEIYLPPLISFRDSLRHSGLIHDPGEGQITIVNQYSAYAGLAKNAPGLLPLMAKNPYEMLCVFGSHQQATLETPGFYAYCMTQFFLSESLAWALGENGKDSCVLITRIDDFCLLVSAAIEDEGARFVDVNGCIYATDDLRRIEERDPSENSITNQLLTARHLAALMKPERYSAQKELRALWEGARTPLKPIIKQVSGVKELCYRVDFSRLDRKKLLEKCASPIPVYVSIRDKSGKVVLNCAIAEPRELFMPVIHYEKDAEPFLGFWNRNAPATKLDSMHVRTPGVVILKCSNIGGIVGNVPLSAVDSIEFSHEEN